jgi:hypothetical protein
MKFKVGLFAPQIFPIPLTSSNDENKKILIKNRITDLAVRLSFFEAEGIKIDPMEHVTKFLKGGALQFFIHHAEPGFVFDIGKIVDIDDDVAEAANYSADANGIIKWRRPKVKGKFYLSKNSSYDKSRLDLISALHRNKLISNDERNDFVTIIDKVVKVA